MTTPPFDPRPIGVFDSGVGGLTVARAIHERLPHESLIYLGDTARVPYGNRGAETVRRYSVNAAKLLVKRDIKALVVACNTASAYGLAHLRDTFDVPILGVIAPVARAAAERTESSSVAVLGTRGTIRSGCYTEAVRAARDGVAVHAIACPLSVPLAEEGWVEGGVVEEVARHYFSALAATSVDTMILGCTHYPLLRATLAAILDELMPRYVTLMDSAKATADELGRVLEARGLGQDPDAEGARTFLVTDEPSGFMRAAVRFFGGRVPSPEHVDIVDTRQSIPTQETM
ncbi:MAG: glutamate racemase [Myxococcota bacterium]